MGCFWSREEREKCRQCRRSAVNNLVIISGVCECCISYNASRSQALLQARVQFGEYHCPCGRKWNSRLSWANNYQICKKCNRHVYPYDLRELRPSDKSNDTANGQEHQQELCGMCSRLGFYCGNYRRRQTTTSVKLTARR